MIEKFESRKNDVALITENGLCYVEKKYTDAARQRIEEKALVALDGMYAPRLLGIGDGLIMLEYLEGELFLDAFLSADITKTEELAESLAQTVIYLYKKLDGKITYDENFRNYIIFDKKIIRLDFEEVRSGTVTEWAAKLAAFAALYDVKDEIKESFAVCLCESLELDPDEFVSATDKEIAALVNRRRLR